MSRYRPPVPRASPYISRPGFQRLEREHKALWQRRKEVTAALTAAAAEGDRSENAEYIYRKKELREIDRRIRYLQKRLPDLQVVEASAGGKGEDPAVFFGARVTIETDAGAGWSVTLLGADEIDPARQYISIDAPLARALLGRRIDDEVSITVEGNIIHYTIVAIEAALPVSS